MQLTEHQIQVSFCGWLEAKKIMHYAVPNGMYLGGGAKRSPREMAKVMGLINKYKKEGMKKGIPDLVIPYPRNGYGALYIEMKSEKGKLSDMQKAICKKLTDTGNKVVVCNSLESAKSETEEYFKD